MPFLSLDHSRPVQRLFQYGLSVVITKAYLLSIAITSVAKFIQILLVAYPLQLFKTSHVNTEVRPQGDVASVF